MDLQHSVLDFWFSKLSPEDWWKKDGKIDAAIRERFFDLHSKGAKGELWLWRKTPEGSLAEILVLDQFSRNLFRNDSKAFDQDAMALALAQVCVGRGYDQKLSQSQKAFVYLPYMHSESLEIHQEALRLFNQPGLEENYEFEVKHLDILKKFGRYPHRNKVLGRESTTEEIEFLKNPGSSF